MIRFFIILVLFLLPLDAEAAIRIRNADGKPATFKLTEIMKSWNVTLAPGEVYTIITPSIAIEYNGKRVWTRYEQEEYIIRKGELTLGRRGSSSNR